MHPHADLTGHLHASQDDDDDEEDGYRNGGALAALGHILRLMLLAVAIALATTLFLYYVAFPVPSS